MTPWPQSEAGVHPVPLIGLTRVVGVGGLSVVSLYQGLAGVLPGAGGWSVAVQDLGAVRVPRGGGAIRVQDQGPALLVDHDQVVVRA